MPGANPAPFVERLGPGRSIGGRVSNRRGGTARDMPVGFLIGLGGGLASALLFYSAARGSPFLGTMLLLLTPLPSLLAGLGWGWLPAAAGALAGTLVMAVAASVPFAAGYFLALGLPVALIPYLAYLSRPQPQDPAKREWYPAGRLLPPCRSMAARCPYSSCR